MSNRNTPNGSRNAESSRNSADGIANTSADTSPRAAAESPAGGLKSSPRRNLVIASALGGGALSTWTKPVVQTMLLPAHAQQSPTPTSTTPTPSGGGAPTPTLPGGLNRTDYIFDLGKNELPFGLVLDLSDDANNTARNITTPEDPNNADDPNLILRLYVDSATTLAPGSVIPDIEVELAGGANYIVDTTKTDVPSRLGALEMGREDYSLVIEPVENEGGIAYEINLELTLREQTQIDPRDLLVVKLESAQAKQIPESTTTTTTSTTTTTTTTAGPTTTSTTTTPAPTTLPPLMAMLVLRDTDADNSNSDDPTRPLVLSRQLDGSINLTVDPESDFGLRVDRYNLVFSTADDITDDQLISTLSNSGESIRNTNNSSFAQALSAIPNLTNRDVADVAHGKALYYRVGGFLGTGLVAVSATGSTLEIDAIDAIPAFSGGANTVEIGHSATVTFNAAGGSGHTVSPYLSVNGVRISVPDNHSNRPRVDSGDSGAMIASAFVTAIGNENNSYISDPDYTASAEGAILTITQVAFDATFDGQHTPVLMNGGGIVSLSSMTAFQGGQAAQALRATTSFEITVAHSGSSDSVINIDGEAVTLSAAITTPVEIASAIVATLNSATPAKTYTAANDSGASATVTLTQDDIGDNTDAVPVGDGFYTAE